MALQQYHVGGTYYGYDPQSGELVAFSDMNQLKQYFPQGIQKNAPTLPSNVDLSKANATPGQVTSPFGGGQAQPAQATPTPQQTDALSKIPGYDQLGVADKAFVSALNTQAQNNYQQGQTNYSINAQTMQQALELAKNDPTIQATYGDQATMALSDLHNNLSQLNAEYAQQYGLTTAEQAQARKQLAEQEAAAGRAYSGFRQQAQGLLKQQQQGVISSSQRQLQQQVRQLGSQYESQFGSKALAGAGPISAGGETYQPYGAITGSQVLGQQQATQAKQQDIYNTISNPLQK